MPRKKKPLTPAQILRRAKAARNREKHTAAIMRACEMASQPMPEREYRFHPERKWRFDFAWPEHRLAIEVNGGGSRGRHNTIAGATADAEKNNEAVLLGWRVLVYTAKSIRDVERIACDVWYAINKNKLGSK